MDETTWLREHLERLEEGLNRLIKFAGPNVSFEIESNAIDMIEAIERHLEKKGLLNYPGVDTHT